MEEREQFEQLVAKILSTWRRLHNEILLYMLDAIPPKGFAALPAVSRGRDVARQLYLDGLSHRAQSHHRGQIALALKQSGMRLSDQVALDGLWGKWIGK